MYYYQSPPEILKIGMIILIEKTGWERLPKPRAWLVPGSRFRLRFESNPNTLSNYYWYFSFSGDKDFPRALTTRTNPFLNSPKKQPLLYKPYHCDFNDTSKR